jgi:hypothetical protein
MIENKQDKKASTYKSESVINLIITITS